MLLLAPEECLPASTRLLREPGGVTCFDSFAFLW